LYRLHVFSVPFLIPFSFQAPTLNHTIWFCGSYYSKVIHISSTVVSYSSMQIKIPYVPFSGKFFVYYPINFNYWSWSSYICPRLYKEIYLNTVLYAVAQWLRCCATNRKVAGSIPDGVISIFNWYNPSDRTMALGSTQPLTEMSTRSISWGWNRPVREADNLTTILGHCHVIWDP